MRNSGLVCFLVVAKFLGIEVPKQREDDYSDARAEYQIIRTAKSLGMKVKSGSFSESAIEKITVPVIVQRKQGDFFIVLKRDTNGWTILNPESGAPAHITAQEFDNQYVERMIILGKGKAAGQETVQKFGFRWFIPTILKFKWQFISVLVAVFIIQIFGIMTPLMTQVVVDKVLSHQAINTLYTIAIGIFIAYIYELIISLAKNYLFVHTTNRIDVILSYKLFHHLFALPLKYFESRRVGETVARVRELDSIRSFLTGTPLSSMIDMVFIVVYIAVMFLYSVPLSIIVIASIPFFAILSLVVTPLFKRSLDRKFEAGAKAQSFLVESINGIQTVKSFALESDFEDKWGELQADCVSAGYKTSMISSTSGTVANFIQRIADLLILVFGAKAVISGSMTIGQLVAFRMLSGRVSGPVLRLVQLWQEYQQASLSVKRIGDIFNSPVEQSDMGKQQKLPAIQGNIGFENVRFRYRVDASDVIHNMSFDIPANRIVGFVGRSGSGKSTISKLIQRLYIPQSGKITVDGMDLSLMNPKQLRSQIGVVLQENFMFNGTVAENIAIHCPDKSMEEIVQAAKVAGAHDFIMELQEGYNTMIGEKGVSLSGGQKQRVAIARAIINNPRILIFDEATSALDYESESIIQNNMKDICQGRTVIIIAHRLSTLRIADEIMVVDKGEIIERGSHDELMNQGGFYNYLYNQQLRGEVE